MPNGYSYQQRGAAEAARRAAYQQRGAAAAQSQAAERSRAEAARRAQSARYAANKRAQAAKSAAAKRRAQAAKSAAAKRGQAQKAAAAKRAASKSAAAAKFAAENPETRYSKGAGATQAQIAASKRAQEAQAARIAAAKRAKGYTPPGLPTAGGYTPPGMQFMAGGSAAAGMSLAEQYRSVAEKKRTTPELSLAENPELRYLLPGYLQPKAMDKTITKATALRDTKYDKFGWGPMSIWGDEESNPYRDPVEYPWQYFTVQDEQAELAAYLGNIADAPEEEWYPDYDPGSGGDGGGGGGEWKEPEVAGRRPNWKQWATMIEQTTWNV